MNVKQLNRIVYMSLVVSFSLFIFSCEKGKCYSQYLAKRYGYKKDSIIVILRQYDNNLMEIDNKDTIETLLIDGYVYNGSYIELETSSSINPSFNERVKKIGGYSYCY